MNSAKFFRSSTGMAFYISSAQIVETKVKEDRWSKAGLGDLSLAEILQRR